MKLGVFLAGTLLVSTMVTGAVGSGGQAVAAVAKPTASPAPKHVDWKAYHDRVFHDYAPADRYFGPMKWSVIGIENVFRDEAISSGNSTTDPAIIHKVTLADQSLADWQRKFPHDPQLARAYFLAIKSYRKIWTKDFQQRAWSYMNLLVKRYPDSYFGKLERKDIAIGFTEHYYADAVACTPAPAATPTQNGRRGSRATPSPSPAPSDSASPAATSSPAPRPGQPKVQIETPPCVTPAPSASPAPAETGGSAASPSASPSAMPHH